MRTLLVIAATLLIAQYTAAQPPAGGRGGGRGGAGGGRGQQPAPPPPPANPGFECFQSVETPEFPHAALQARVDGTAWLSITLTPQAAVDKIGTQITSAWGTASKLLTPAVEKAVRASKFKTDCAGKTVDVVYRYELHGEPTASPKVTNRMEPPNIMYIESQPESAAAAAKSAAPAK
jgi:hypothetical protein